MKIKTTKKSNLPELIQHVWENDIGSESFESKFGVEVIFGENRAVIMNHFVGKDDTFTVEVEEELTEDTAIPHIVHIFKDTGGRRRAENLYKESVSSGRFPIGDEPISMAMYSSKDDGTLTLIWSRESGIPESGVLRVGAE